MGYGFLWVSHRYAHQNPCRDAPGSNLDLCLSHVRCRLTLLFHKFDGRSDMTLFIHILTSIGIVIKRHPIRIRSIVVVVTMTKPANVAVVVILRLMIIITITITITITIIIIIIIINIIIIIIIIIIFIFTIIIFIIIIIIIIIIISISIHHSPHLHAQCHDYS